ncbi:hypothetical protein CYJ46_04825 [Corynebacterium coyleae]|uniref:hypothetical protein n=1 Tax=Corynebacterium coyleae TaxID=53374 RepID=UPI000C78EDD6|nr:hypothetical protein [Corynebacterium coyleae]PLA38389.1 hypothetical protein CYJ46_04825 [Corynebacterium coyleae]
MKRTAAAVLAATTALSLAAVPAQAAEGSSKAYSECVTALKQYDNEKEKARKSGDATDKAAAALADSIVKGAFEEAGIQGSTNEGTCINALTHPTSDYRSSALAFLILVPLAIVGVLGAGAAYAGVIPGVELPF